MWDLVREMEEVYIVLYCLIILWVNVSYLKDYKNIRRGMEDIPPEDEVLIKPGAWNWVGIALIFNFFRRWLIYLFAVVLTGNGVVAVISAILFVIDLYDILFHYSLAKVKKSIVPLALAIVDSLYIAVFVIYLLFV